MSDHKAGAGWARAAGVAAPRPLAPAPRAHGRMDGRTDGQTAAPATATPDREQASHGFVFLLWLWVLLSSSPPFSLSLVAFRYGRCRRVAACSGELLCLQASSAR